MTLPSEVTRAQLDACPHVDQLHDLVLGEALAKYEAKEEEIGKETLPRDRTAGDALRDRPALARAPLRDGLPARGHQPAGHGPEGPAVGVAAGGLRHVRDDDGGHRGGLRPLRHPPAGHRRGRPQLETANLQYSAPEDPVQGAQGLLRRARRRPPTSRPTTRPLALSAEDEAFDAFSPEATQTPVQVDKTARPQRALLLRERQEVQALPRPLTVPVTASRGSAPCVISPIPSPRSVAASRRARPTCRVDEAQRPAPPSSRPRRPSPDLWDDPDRARAVTTELARPATTSSSSRPSNGGSPTSRRSPAGPRGERRLLRAGEIDTELADPQRRARPARAAGALHRGARRARRHLRGPLRRRRHRRPGLDPDAAAHVTRWAERRGFGVEIDEVQPGTEAGITSATFTVKGRYAYGLLRGSGASTGSSGSRPSTPTPAARPLRLASTASPPSTRPRSPTSTRPSCASTPTAPRARAASTST